MVKNNKMGKIGVEIKKKKKVNFKLFDSDMIKESAYLLGLLWADGHIRGESKLTTINCVLEDIDDILKVFKKTGDWNVSKPIKKTFNGKSVKTQRRVSTTTWGLYYILKENDYLIKSKSSPTKILSKIPKHLKKYWYLGYLDGDGCIKLGKKYGVDVVFTAPLNNNWGFMVNLCKKLNINYSINNIIINNGGYSHFRINKKLHVKKICDYLYSDYEIHNIGFKRKYNKYNDVLSYINKMSLIHWTDDNIKFLIENYYKIGGLKCSTHLNKNLTSVYNKVRDLKVKNIIFN